MPLKTSLPYHHDDETLEEGKPIKLVLEVSGNLEPPVTARTTGPTEKWREAEGGTFEITEIKPIMCYLAGEALTDFPRARYRELTGYQGTWADLVDKDVVTDLAIADYKAEQERDYEEFRHDKENVWYEDGQLDDQIEREREDKDARGYSA